MLASLAKWCAEQEPGAQHEIRAAIISIVRKFMDKFAELFRARATTWLSQRARAASQTADYQALKIGALSVLRDHLCRCVLLRGPTAESLSSLDAMMKCKRVDINGRWDAMIKQCREGAGGGRVAAGMFLNRPPTLVFAGVADLARGTSATAPAAGAPHVAGAKRRRDEGPEAAQGVSLAVTVPSVPAGGARQSAERRVVAMQPAARSSTQVAAVRPRESGGDDSGDAAGSPPPTQGSATVRGACGRLVRRAPTAACYPCRACQWRW